MSKRVLVIDDDRDHAESIVDILSMHGYVAEAAFSGEDGIKVFRNADFDMVLMERDIRTILCAAYTPPHASGDERALRQLP